MKTNIISAVGVVLLNDKNQVLLAKRNPDKPMPCKWEFPGGKVEDNESLEACGIREIKEELGLDIKINKYLGFENLSYEGKEFCLHLFTGCILGKDQELHLEVHSEALWLEYFQLEKYDFPAYNLSFMKPLQKLLQG